MTIVSALISQCRREYGDEPKSVRVARDANGLINVFNVGKFPVVEGSYYVYLGTSAKTEVTDYNFDLDNGDLNFLATPANALTVKADLKYAEWRDKNWLEAINQGIESLNARGFFRQTVRQQFTFSANVRSISGPSACVDVYELLFAPASGQVSKLRSNWSYQQDANKIVLGNPFPTSYTGYRSYLRNLQTAPSTTGTIDVLSDWTELVKKRAGAIFYRSLAGKIAKQGNANIDEGHFSFTNLRTMANDLDADFERLAARKKPTRPAKDFQYRNANGGVA